MTDKQLEKLTKNKNFKKLYEGVHPAFLDENGRPLRFLHGTKYAGFFGFLDPGERMKNGETAEPGVWMTPDLNTAMSYTDSDYVQEFVPFVAKDWEDAGKKIRKNYDTLDLQYDEDEGMWLLVDTDPELYGEDEVGVIAEFIDTDKELARFNEEYGIILREFDSDTYGKSIYQLFLPGKKPLIVNAAGHFWNDLAPYMLDDPILQQAALDFMDEQTRRKAAGNGDGIPAWAKGGLIATPAAIQAQSQLDDQKIPRMKTRDFVYLAEQLADSMGYDTVIFRNVKDGRTVEVEEYNLARSEVTEDEIMDIIRRNNNLGYRTAMDAFLHVEIAPDVDLDSLTLSEEDREKLEQYMDGQQNAPEIPYRVVRDTSDVYVALSTSLPKSVHNTGTWGQTKDPNIAGNEIRYSVESTMPFKGQVNRALSESVEENRYNALYIRETPNILAEVGLGDLPMCITAKHVKDIVHAEEPGKLMYHDIPVGMVKRIPELLSKPAMILDSQSKAGDVVVVTTELDKKNRPVVISIHPNGSARVDGNRGPANFITSMYGRESFENWIDWNAKEGRVLYWNKERSDTLFSSARIKCPGGLNAIASDTIIREHAGYVKENIPERRFSVEKNGNQVRTGGSTGNVNPDTGYERGSIADSFARMINAGDRQGALTMMEQMLQKMAEAQAEQAEQRRNDATAAAFRPAALTEDSIARNKRIIQELIDKYGKMEQTSAAQQEVNLPKQIDDETKVRGFMQTAAAADVTSEAVLNEFERSIVSGDAGATYVPIGDKETMNKIQQELEKDGFDKMLRNWDSLVQSERRAEKLDIARAEQLYVEACNNRDVATAQRLAAEIAAIGTQAGQTVQAMTLLKKMTPSGNLYYIQKAVDKLNREQKGKHQDITIDPKLAKQLLEAETQQDIQDALDAITQDLADQMPVTLADKWNAWRYLAMLGNPRTHIRNVMGNAVFTPARLAKDVMGAAIERTLPQDQRTKSVVVSKDLREFAKADAVEMEDTLRGGGKYNPADMIRDKRRVFKSSPLNWAEKFNSSALEVEDWWFLKSAYTHALSGFLSARGADVKTLSGAESTREGRALLAEARAYAVQEAQKATYRDASKVAAMLNHGKRNTGKVGNILLEGLVPFTKTPVNIVKRGVEYSPIGLVKGAADMLINVKNGKMNASEAIDELCAGMTGTAIVAIGAWLTSMGLLQGGMDDDDEEDQFKKLQGYQEYALKIGDNTYTIDWMAPVALPLFVGSEIYNAMSGSFDGMTLDNVLSRVLDGLATIMEPMLSLSMLDGLNQTLSANKYDSADMALWNVAKTMAGSYFSQGVPTLLGQIARTVDDSRRTSFTPKGAGGLESWLSRTWQTSVQGKIPVYAEERMLYIDNWGNADTESSIAMRAVENFLSPGYFNQIKTTDVDEELSRLAEATGNNSVLPGRAKKSFTVDGEDYAMSQEEYQAHLIERGQKSYSLVSNIIHDRTYQDLDDDTRAQAVKLAYDYASAMAKVHTTDKYTGADKWMLELADLEERGGDAAEYLMLRAASKQSNKSLIETALGSKSLTDSDMVDIITMETNLPSSFTDPYTSGYEYIMDDKQQAEYEKVFRRLLAEEYAYLKEDPEYQNANSADQYEMVKDMRSDVSKRTREEMSDWFFYQGIDPTEKKK